MSSPRTKLVVCLYALVFVAVSAWMLSAGQFTLIFRDMHDFIENPFVRKNLPAWEMTNFFAALLIFTVWVSTLLGVLGTYVMIFMSKLFGQPLSKTNEAIKNLLNNLPKNVIPLFFRLLGLASVEEFLFRWFPLVVVFSFWNGQQNVLWAFIIGSSAMFALCHVFWYKTWKHRLITIPLTASHCVGGFILSYTFLVYGIVAAIFLHACYNFIVIFPFWFIEREKYAPSSHTQKTNIEVEPVYDFSSSNQKIDPFAGHFKT